MCSESFLHLRSVCQKKCSLRALIQASANAHHNKAMSATERQIQGKGYSLVCSTSMPRIVKHSFSVARLEGAKPHHKRNDVRAQAGLYCAKDYESETRAVDEADLLKHGGAWQEQVNRQQIRHASMSPHIGVIS